MGQSPSGRSLVRFRAPQQGETREARQGMPPSEGTGLPDTQLCGRSQCVDTFDSHQAASGVSLRTWGELI